MNEALDRETTIKYGYINEEDAKQPVYPYIENISFRMNCNNPDAVKPPYAVKTVTVDEWDAIWEEAKPE